MLVFVAYFLKQIDQKGANQPTTEPILAIQARMALLINH